MRAVSSVEELQLVDVDGLRSFFTLHDFILNGSALIEGLEAFHVEPGVVYEDIVSGLVGDEAIALLIVEPLYCALVHRVTSAMLKLT